MPESASPKKPLPVAYVTDGAAYLHSGNMHQVVTDLLASKQLQPIVIVYIDSRDPTNLNNNRRTKEFMCNSQYAQFVRSELIPKIASQYPVSPRAEDRLIMGLSFGGLNAACFGLMLPDSFHHIGMHSPASGDHIKLIASLYKKQDKLPLDFYFSVGTQNDNTREARKFHRILKKKKYPVTYQEVPYGHTWENWSPLIDDLLLTFFAQKQPQ